MALSATQQRTTWEVKAILLWKGLEAWLRAGGGLKGFGAQADTVTFKFQKVLSGQEGEWMGRNEAGGAEAGLRGSGWWPARTVAEGRATREWVGYRESQQLELAELRGQLEVVQESRMTNPSGPCDGGSLRSGF